MSYFFLLMFFGVEYVRPTSYVPALTILHLNSIVPLIAFAGSVLSGTASAAFRWLGSDPGTRAVAALLTLVGISLITSDVQTFAWDRFTAILGYAIIFVVLASELTTISRIQGVLATLVLVHVIVAALSPEVFANPDQRNYIASGAFLGDGNDFSLSLNIVLPFCLFLFLNARVWLRPLWGFAMLVLVACVVLSQSRGGTLGLGAMAIYYWLKSPKKVQTGAVAVLVTMLILALAPSAYFTRMHQIGDTNEGSAAGRLMAWGVAIRMAADNPLLGVGAGHFPTKFANEYRPKDLSGPAMTAHSVYFLALGELGVPGLVALIYFIVSGLMANRRLAMEVRRRHGPKAIEIPLLASMSAAIIAFAVSGAFLSCLYYPHLYIIAGLLAAVRNVVRQRCLQPAAEQSTVPTASKEIWLHPALRPAPSRPLVSHTR